MADKPDHRSTGQQYESVAKDYLVQQGLLFIEKNFSCRSGEIDLIFRQGETYVFVEVKYRKTQSYGHPAEFVTASKCKRLVKTAQFWLQKQGISVYSTELRFDVVAITGQPRTIDWIKNAVLQG